jgi:hypothetical protein
MLGQRQARETKERTAERDRLYQQIGKLQVEVEWLKKSGQRLYTRAWAARPPSMALAARSPWPWRPESDVSAALTPRQMGTPSQLPSTFYSLFWVEGCLDGGVHLTLQWDLKTIVDQVSRYEVDLYARGANQTADVTPRRLVNFVVTPGESYRYTNQRSGATGKVAADARGVLTVPAVAISTMGSRLMIVPE